MTDSGLIVFCGKGSGGACEKTILKSYREVGRGELAARGSAVEIFFDGDYVAEYIDGWKKAVRGRLEKGERRDGGIA